MKNLLRIALLMSCLTSCSQSHDIAGEYERKSGTSIYLLKLHPSGVFHFDSYTNGLNGNLPSNNKLSGNQPAEPSISGRGTWRADNDVIYFSTNRDTDVDYEYTLNFTDTKAKFISESPKDTIQ